MRAGSFDALEPSVLVALVQYEIDNLRDDYAWNLAVTAMEAERECLQAVSDNWIKVKKSVAPKKGK